jgi:mannose-6-phosphate isomerase-like protein (cupin superfamily)
MAKNHLQIIDIGEKTKGISETWKNFVLGEVNDHVIRVSVLDREFHWHRHPETDEAFLVISGELFIDLEDKTVSLKEGQIFIVPRGTKHRTRANGKSVNLTFEHKGSSAEGEKVDA